MKGYLFLAAVSLLMTGIASSVHAAEGVKTYTNRYSLYAVDYPETWRAKEVGKATAFYSPLKSKEDKFSENVQVVVEDLSQVPGDVSVVDYHRKGVATAQKFLSDFKALEEAKIQWSGRDAIVMLYSATMRGKRFKFKDYKVIVDRTAYVLTYCAADLDFDTYLPAAERLIRSLRVSP